MRVRGLVLAATVAASSATACTGGTDGGPAPATATPTTAASSSASARPTAGPGLAPVVDAVRRVNGQLVLLHAVVRGDAQGPPPSARPLVVQQLQSALRDARAHLGRTGNDPTVTEVAPRLAEVYTRYAAVAQRIGAARGATVEPALVADLEAVGRDYDEALRRLEELAGADLPPYR